MVAYATEKLSLQDCYRFLQIESIMMLFTTVIYTTKEKATLSEKQYCTVYVAMQSLIT